MTFLKASTAKGEIMSDYKKGYDLSKDLSNKFETISEIKSKYKNMSDDFIRGVIDGFDEYWTDKLMGEF